MTRNSVAKKIRQFGRRQIRGMRDEMWAEVQKQFFSMIPQLSLWRRVKLASKILRAKNVQMEDGFYLFRESPDRHWRLIFVKDGMAEAGWLAPGNKLKVGDLRGEFEKLDHKDPHIEICKKDSMWRLIEK